MTNFTAYLLAALVLAASVALIAVDSAEAQQTPGENAGQSSGNKTYRNYGVGGTSLTLRDIWGPAEMPKPSLDYPAFNYPPGGYDLNGPPSQSPYPN